MSPPAPSRNPRHHVLMTTDTVGGVWTYTTELCRGLARFGTHVSLLSMGGPPDDAQRRSISVLSNVTLIPTAYRLEWMPDCEDDLKRSGRLLLAVERMLRPDIVHINGYWHAALPFDAPRLVVTHSCVPSWWAACRDTPLPPEWAPYREWVRKAVLAANIVVAPTAAYLRELQHLYGAARHSLVIWNGRDATFFTNGPKQNVALAAGRLWDEAKNIAIVCEAARGLNVPIVVAGDSSGPQGGALEMRNVTALGKLSPEELVRWMSSAAIFVAPSRYEPFGLGILEAALSFCALVLSDLPSLRELWDGAALFIDPNDVDGLRRILRDLAADPAKAAKLGREARTRAETYSVERMTQAYHQAYSALAAPRLEAVA